MNSVKVYLSLGSNLGDRESNLAQATMALSINFEVYNIESSSYYASEPLYNNDQPEFLNAVVKCDTTLRPFDFLDVTKRIEKMLGRAEGGLMNLGGMEMDLRGGGFVPLGAKEKADDVPARLSKNEFVMTADAVRAAGGGSIDKGADKMYNLMKDLEAKV